MSRPEQGTAAAFGTVAHPAHLRSSDAVGPPLLTLVPCCGLAAVVPHPNRHQIIRAGDALDQIYLIVAGEVEMYHDLAADGPDARLPGRPLIQGGRWDCRTASDGHRAEVHARGAGRVLSRLGARRRVAL